MAVLKVRRTVIGMGKEVSQWWWWWWGCNV